MHILGSGQNYCFPKLPKLALSIMVLTIIIQMYPLPIHLYPCFVQTCLGMDQVYSNNYTFCAKKTTRKNKILCH